MLTILHLWYLCSILSLWRSSGVEGKLETSEIIGEKNLKILSTAITKNDYLSYVACDPQKVLGYLKCKVVFGKLSGGKFVRLEDDCIFSKKLEGDGNPIENLNMTIQFLKTDKKFVVSWSETTMVNSYQHVVSIEIPKKAQKCKIKYSTFTQSTSNVSLNDLIVYEDKFDVVTFDKGKCKPQGFTNFMSTIFQKQPEEQSKGCRIRYDKEGDFTDKIEKFHTGMYRFGVTPVLETESAGGFFVYGWENYGDKSLMMKYVSKTGVPGNSVKSGIDGSPEDLLISTSNTHEQISLCAYGSKSRGKLQCQQYSSQDITKMNLSLKKEYAYSDKIESISVLNLPERRLVATTVESKFLTHEKLLAMWLHTEVERNKKVAEEKLNANCKNIELISVEGEKSICSYALCAKDKSRSSLISHKLCVRT